MMFVLAKQLASVKWLFDSRSDLDTTTLVTAGAYNRCKT